MESATRRYYYPLRNYDNPMYVTLVEITEAQYRVLYPEIWRTQKHERKLGRCLCPRKMLWKCDGDCLVCCYHTNGNIWSLDYELEKVGDHRDNGESDPADIVVDRLLLERLVLRMKELCPEALEVGELKMDGLSERKSLEVLGLPRTSFRWHLRTVKQTLLEEFGDIFGSLYQ